MIETTAIQPPVLLTDDQVGGFVARGYHLVEPDFPKGFNEAVFEDIRRLERHPGNGILDAVPRLYEVYDHPAVRGALISLLGEDYRMNPHRHLHENPPGSQSQGWHQDGTNVRHHQVWTVLAMYYPHDVPAENGPTVVMPGTHFRNAPTDRLQTYANLKGQVALTVKAGTVAITHYDLWHAMSLNRAATPRYMLKFLFDRQSPPVRPSWNHSPDADKVVRKWITGMVGSQGYCSDYYKEWELRLEMWRWITGHPTTIPPGAFKDILG
ncbi:MAG: phytanoyl-CoA dioxygenase family protein [candidate division Zixibacteria bacterium]|nr:phytanoyl-CoA dioxygenase family protein [candidate division Zixibacteria bacterium]